MRVSVDEKEERFFDILWQLARFEGTFLPIYHPIMHPMDMSFTHPFFIDIREDL